MTPFATVYFALLGYFMGSLPFSLWVGRLWLGKDIRAFGDANPGATNVFRAGGRGAGVIAVLLDVLKAAIPTGLAWFWAGETGWPMGVIAAAPVAGHAFSPFLGFRGGKAVAATFGTWAGLTVWEGPTILGVSLWMTTRTMRNDGWAVIGAMVCMLMWLVLTPPTWNGLGARPPLPVILTAWVLNMAVLIWKHRADLSKLPRLRPVANR